MPTANAGSYYSRSQFGTYGVPNAPSTITVIDPNTGQPKQVAFTVTAAQYVGNGQYNYYGFAPDQVVQYDTPMGPSVGTIAAGTPSSMGFFSVGAGQTEAQPLSAFPWSGQPVPDINLNPQTGQLGYQQGNSFVPVSSSVLISGGDPLQGANVTAQNTGESSPSSSLAGADYALTLGGDFSNPFGVGLRTPDVDLGLNFNTAGDVLNYNLSTNLGEDFDFGLSDRGFQLGADTDIGDFSLTGGPSLDTLNVGGAVNTPVGTVSGDTNVPTNLDDFDAETNLGDALEGAGDFIYTLFTDPAALVEGGFDLGSLEGLDPTQAIAEVEQFLANPGNSLGELGDYLSNEGQQLYDRYLGGESSSSSGGGSTPTAGSGGGGGGGGGVNPLWSLLGGVLGLLGNGQNKTVQNTASRDVGSPLLTGTDPISRQFQGALGTQLNAPDVANNPYFQPALNAAFAPVMDNFMTQVLPGIRGQAVTSGNVGGSRQGIAEAGATRDLTRNLSNAGAQAAYQFNQAGMQNQANALQTLLGARGGTGTDVSRSTTTELDPVTQFLSGLTGSLGLIGEYNKIAGGG